MSRIDLSEGLSLKQLERSDAPAIYEAIHRDADWLGAWLPFVRPTVEAGLPMTQAYVDSVVLPPGCETRLVFAILQDGEFAGLVGLTGVDWDNAKAEIGYWLCRRFTGRGLATRSARCLLARAFRGLSLNRVVLRAAPGNGPSLAVARRLGFTLEGVERDAERFADGHYVDAMVFSLLAREWKGTAADEGTPR